MHNQLTRYLVVPGWQGSGPDHWQTHWETLLPNAVRVEQSEWSLPIRQDWVATLERSISSNTAPVILIAHSLGCVAVAHWAAQASPATLALVKGALLVAPADVERPNCPAALSNFAPISKQVLPFPSLMIASDNDRAATAYRAGEMARAWGSDLKIMCGAGHINPASGFQHWEAGFAYLYQLQSTVERKLRRYA